MTEIEKLERKMAALINRREKIASNIQRLSIEAKQLEKEAAALQAQKTRLLCGKFGQLLEKNSIAIQDVDLEKIVRAISANKDAYKTQKIKTAAANEDGAADEDREATK